MQYYTELNINTENPDLRINKQHINTLMRKHCFIENVDHVPDFESGFWLSTPGIFSQNFTSRVKIVRLLKYEHLHLQYLHFTRGVNCQTRARAPRARDAWRKFTEIYGNPRAAAARALCIDFLPVIGTVHLAVLAIVGTRVNVWWTPKYQKLSL